MNIHHHIIYNAVIYNLFNRFFLNINISSLHIVFNVIRFQGKVGYVTFDDNELVHIWNDVMDWNHRDLTMMIAGFNFD